MVKKDLGEEIACDGGIVFGWGVWGHCGRGCDGGGKGRGGKMAKEDLAQNGTSLEVLVQKSQEPVEAIGLVVFMEEASKSGPEFHTFGDGARPPDAPVVGVGVVDGKHV